LRILTSNFSIQGAERFLETIQTSNPHYMFVGRTLLYDTESIPVPGNSTQSILYDVFDKMIFGKYVPQSNSSLMLRNIEWVSGTVYTEYDHLDENLFDKDFYVVTEQGGDRSVFKCISNNRGATSTAKPVLSETSPVDDLYQTSDGYIWKLMFTVPQATYEKFASECQSECSQVLYSS